MSKSIFNKQHCINIQTKHRKMLKTKVVNKNPEVAKTYHSYFLYLVFFTNEATF